MLVVGAVNVDLVVRVPRLPGPGETVIGPDLERHQGGKGANAAVAAARAGARADLVGAVGDDDLGRGALGALADEGVGARNVAVRSGRPTGAALIVVDEVGEPQVTVAAGANADLDPEAVAAAVEGAGPGTVVVVSTEVPLAAAQAAVEAGTAGGLAVVLDPAPVVPGLERLLAAGPLATPNATECRQLAGCPDGDLAEAAAALAGVTGGPVVVTDGADGVLLARTDGSVLRRPALRVGAVDATGAGDTFTGVLAAWLAAGADLVGAVDAAVVAAALSVTGEGARGAMPTGDAIRSALADR